MADGTWVIRAQLDRPAAMVWYREPFAYWMPVERHGQTKDGTPILKEVGRPLSGIWIAADNSEIVDFTQQEKENGTTREGTPQGEGGEGQS